MKTLQAIFATDKFVMLGSVGVEYAFELVDEVAQLFLAVLLYFDVSFNSCFLALLKRYVLGKVGELVVQIGTVAIDWLCARILTILRIGKQAFAGLTGHADFVLITSAVPLLTTLLVFRLALATDLCPLSLLAARGCLHARIVNLLPGATALTSFTTLVFGATVVVESWRPPARRFLARIGTM